MFLISNNKEVKESALAMTRGLVHHNLDEFTVWYDPSLAFIKEMGASKAFFYGLCHTWQQKQPSLLSGPVSSKLLFSDYFFMSFDSDENSYTFHTDHVGLGSVTYCHKGFHQR